MSDNHAAFLNRMIDEANRKAKTFMVLAAVGWLVAGVAVAWLVVLWNSPSAASAPKPSVHEPMPSVVMPPKSPPKTSRLVPSGTLTDVSGLWKIQEKNDTVNGMVFAAVQVSLGEDGPTREAYGLASIIVRHRELEGWQVYLVPDQMILQGAVIDPNIPVTLRLDNGRPEQVYGGGMTGGSISIGDDKLIRRLLAADRLALNISMRDDSKEVGTVFTLVFNCSFLREVIQEVN